MQKVHISLRWRKENCFLFPPESKEKLMPELNYRSSLLCETSWNLFARAARFSARLRALFPEAALLDYLVCGGFPKARGLDTSTRYRRLSDCVALAMFRDVVERYGVRNLTSLCWLVRHLLANRAVYSAWRNFMPHGSRKVLRWAGIRCINSWGISKTAFSSVRHG